METGQLAMRYIGYKNKRMVPFRLLRYNGVYTNTIKDEGYVRNALCMTQKIGNGAQGCTIFEQWSITERWRHEGRLKRNHYVYEVVATIRANDMPLYDKIAIRKIGHTPRDDGTAMQDLSQGQACELGFCD